MPTGALGIHALPPGAPELPAITASQVFVDSTDGARVPMVVLHRADVPPDGDRPTILYGYGGFANAMTPGYASTTAAWVEAGGVFAVACLRGGD